MALSSAQLKGRIKNLALKNHADPRMVVRIYMMDRFLERLSKSKYKDRFIIKGGVLVTSLLGISKRTTMDIDTSIHNADLSFETIGTILNEIIAIDLKDGITFKILNIETIMDEMEYPGVRVAFNALMEEMVTPFKLDISTGDVITPDAISYSYKLLLENREISLLSYNIETILAEKIETILSRGALNTRMRDFYDVYALTNAYKSLIDTDLVKKAIYETSKNRNSLTILSKSNEIIEEIICNSQLQKLWNSYIEKCSFAKSISYKKVIDCLIPYIK